MWSPSGRRDIHAAQFLSGSSHLQQLPPAQFSPHLLAQVAPPPPCAELRFHVGYLQCTVARRRQAAWLSHRLGNNPHEQSKKSSIRFRWRILPSSRPGRSASRSSISSISIGSMKGGQQRGRPSESFSLKGLLRQASRMTMLSARAGRAKQKAGPRLSRG